MHSLMLFAFLLSFFFSPLDCGPKNSRDLVIVLSEKSWSTAGYSSTPQPEPARSLEIGVGKVGSAVCVIFSNSSILDA